MYYAAYNPHGTDTSFGSGNKAVVLLFDTKKQRDTWVGEGKPDIIGAYHRQVLSATEAKRFITKGNEVIDKRRKAKGKDT